MPSSWEQVVTIPFAANVVPSDQAAGRIVDPTVQTEVVFQEAQQSKRLASEALERGDRTLAESHLDDVAGALGMVAPFAPALLPADVDS